jgi:hypothetical protein
MARWFGESPFVQKAVVGLRSIKQVLFRYLFSHSVPGFGDVECDRVVDLDLNFETV